jgi:hypothetical protein
MNYTSKNVCAARKCSLKPNMLALLENVCANQRDLRWKKIFAYLGLMSMKRTQHFCSIFMLNYNKLGTRM